MGAKVLAVLTVEKWLVGDAHIIDFLFTLTRILRIILSILTTVCWCNLCNTGESLFILHNFLNAHASYQRLKGSLTRSHYTKFESTAVFNTFAHWRVLLTSRMGSVLAASSPNPPPPAPGGAAVPGLTVPPGFGMPPVSSVVSPSDSVSGQQRDAESTLPNPGAFDECHRKCKGK